MLLVASSLNVAYLRASLGCKLSWLWRGWHYHLARYHRNCQAGWVGNVPFCTCDSSWWCWCWWCSFYTFTYFYNLVCFDLDGEPTRGSIRVCWSSLCRSMALRSVQENLEEFLAWSMKSLASWDLESNLPSWHVFYVFLASNLFSSLSIYNPGAWSLKWTNPLAKCVCPALTKLMYPSGWRKIAALPHCHLFLVAGNCFILLLILLPLINRKYQKTNGTAHEKKANRKQKRHTKIGVKEAKENILKLSQSPTPQSHWQTVKSKATSTFQCFTATWEPCPQLSQLFPLKNSKSDAIGLIVESPWWCQLQIILACAEVPTHHKKWHLLFKGPWSRLTKWRSPRKSSNRSQQLNAAFFWFLCHISLHLHDYFLKLNSRFAETAVMVVFDLSFWRASNTSVAAFWVELVFGSTHCYNAWNMHWSLDCIIMRYNLMNLRYHISYQMGRHVTCCIRHGSCSFLHSLLIKCSPIIFHHHHPS